MGCRPVAARLRAASGCHDRREVGYGRLAACEYEIEACLQVRRAATNWLGQCNKNRTCGKSDNRSYRRQCCQMKWSKTRSRINIRECTRAALDLDVLGLGLAAIGDLFVFDRLPLIKRRKPSFLHCRNVNENVLPAARGLDESVALGWVEPLDRTFSHPSSPRV